MTIFEECKKLANLFYSERHKDTYGLYGRVIFDHKTYDEDDDIPHFIVEGKRYKIWEASINEDGTKLRFATSKNDSWMTFILVLDEYTEDELIDMNIDGVLRDMYYETDLSGEIGDYELDFLKS